jgi:hypothetical protein
LILMRVCSREQCLVKLFRHGAIHLKKVIDYLCVTQVNALVSCRAVSLSVTLSAIRGKGWSGDGGVGFAATVEG